MTMRPLNRRQLGIALIGVAVVLVVAGLGVAVAAGSGPQTNAATGPRPSVMDGKPAPDLAGTTLTGGQFRLQPTGQVTVVNIWASWCGPCREEVPSLVRTQQQWRDRGVRLVTINTKDGPVAARYFLRQLHVTDLLAVSDPQGRLAVAWGATGVPETVIVDQRGIVRARWLGAVSQDWLADQLSRWAR